MKGERMRACRRFRAGIPHCGAGTHVLLTRAPLPVSPKRDRTYDLHVLGTPPAFILSQDQTRHASMVATARERAVVSAQMLCSRSSPRAPVGAWLARRCSNV